MLNLLAVQAEFNEFLRRTPELSAQEQQFIAGRLLDAQGGVWKYLVPLKEGGRALIAGAGWHNSFLFLAEHFPEMVVWDADPLRVSILERLAHLLGLKPRFESGEIEALLKELPEQDLIVFEDSLSWIPGHPAGRPYSAQADMMQKASRLLSERGACLVAVPNRLALDRLLRRQRDAKVQAERAGMPEANLRMLPQGNDGNGSGGPGCWVPSLLRAFEGAGLRHQRLYFLYPSRESPEQILGWGNNEPSGEQHPLVRVLNHAGMGKYFFDSPVFVAGRGSLEPSFLEELLARIGERLGLRKPPRIRRNLLSNESTLVFFLELEDNEQAVLKLPVSAAGASRVESDRRMLEKAREISPDKVRGLVPQVKRYESLRGQPFLVRSYVPGVDACMLVRSREEYSRVVAEAAQVLLEWHQASHRVTRVTPGVCETHLLRYFRQAGDYLPEQRGLLEELEDFVRKTSADQALPLGFVHGDFHLHNVMIDPSTWQLSGILDWDMGEAEGLQALDLFHLLTSKERALRGCGIGEVFDAVVLPGAFDDAERRLVEEFRGALGLSEGMLLCLKIAYWARHCLGNLVQAGGLKPAEWMRENVFNVLDTLHGTVLGGGPGSGGAAK